MPNTKLKPLVISPAKPRPQSRVVYVESVLYKSFGPVEIRLNAQNRVFVVFGARGIGWPCLIGQNLRWDGLVPHLSKPAQAALIQLLEKQDAIRQAHREDFEENDDQYFN